VLALCHLDNLAFRHLMSLTPKTPPNGYDWREDLRRFLKMVVHFDIMFWVALVGLVAALALTNVARLLKSARSVVVYAAQDQVYAEPILKHFEKQTGIKVRAVYDSEATKTVAIANRLLAEREHPQCDVYWGNEELRTRQLASRGVFRETNGWAAFGYRSRRMVVSTRNTEHGTRSAEPFADASASLLALTNPVYRGKIVLAYPLFGTTATHFLALRQHWGETNWLVWCRALAANKPFLVDGNSVAVKFVARGEAAVGLTDSDDIAAGIREGARLRPLPMTGETLQIPNTVAVVRRAPHPEAAQHLFEYLQTPAVTDRLLQAGALEGPSVTGMGPTTLKPDWEALLRELETGTAQLQEIFLR
jgi:iron(III) transport system substrate-binding protein